MKTDPPAQNLLSKLKKRPISRRLRKKVNRHFLCQIRSKREGGTERLREKRRSKSWRKRTHPKKRKLRRRKKARIRNRKRTRSRRKKLR